MINVILAFMIIASFLLAVIIHELGHALVATWLGDPTPRASGRLSLGLRPHIDALGTILCIILAFFPAIAGPVGLGWGQPVKTDPWKLRGGPNGGTILVAVGGILFSLATGAVFSIVLRFLPAALYDNAIAARLPQLILVFAITNFALAIFNIIPLYPLDGYQIVYALLPSRQAIGFARSAPYGQFIILLLIFFLPFIGQISGAGSFFLFHLTFYILQGSAQLTSLVSGISNITSSLASINQFSLLDFYIGF